MRAAELVEFAPENMQKIQNGRKKIKDNSALEAFDPLLTSIFRNLNQILEPSVDQYYVFVSAQNCEILGPNNSKRFFSSRKFRQSVDDAAKIVTIFIPVVGSLFLVGCITIMACHWFKQNAIEKEVMVVQRQRKREVDDMFAPKKKNTGDSSSSSDSDSDSDSDSSSGEEEAEEKRKIDQRKVGGIYPT